MVHRRWLKTGEDSRCWPLYREKLLRQIFIRNCITIYRGNLQLIESHNKWKLIWKRRYRIDFEYLESRIYPMINFPWIEKLKPKFFETLLLHFPRGILGTKLSYKFHLAPDNDCQTSFVPRSKKHPRWIHQPFHHHRHSA